MHSKKTIIVFATWMQKSIHSQFIQFCKALAKEGHKTIFVSDQQKKIPKTDTNDFFEVFVWPSKTPRTINDLRFVALIYKKTKPDIVIGNFSSVYTAIPVAYLFGIPQRIAFFHTSLSIRNTITCRSIFFRRLLYKTTTKVISVSDELQAKSTELFAVPISKALILYNSVDIKPIQNKPKPKLKQITVVASLEKWKGIDLFLLAISKVKKKALAPYQINIIGGGSLKNELKRISMDLKLQSKVNFLGVLPFHKVQMILAESEFFVLPSRAEGMPQSILEAMVHSCIVIASDVGGIPVMIEDGINGLLFPSEQHEYLTQQLNQILPNKELKARLAKNAFSTVKDKFSTESWIRKLKQILNIND